MRLMVDKNIRIEIEFSTVGKEIMLHFQTCWVNNLLYVHSI